MIILITIVWVNVCKQNCWLITKREWRIKGIDDSCAMLGLCLTLSTAYDVIMFFNSLILSFYNIEHGKLCCSLFLLTLSQVQMMNCILSVISISKEHLICFNFADTSNRLRIELIIIPLNTDHPNWHCLNVQYQ